jgi:hypothetical protein
MTTIRLSVLMLGMLVFATGCGRRSLPETDLARARIAVETTLESWKKGEMPEALKERSIDADDPDWASGERLVDFMIYDAEGRKRDRIRCGVLLTLLDRQGSKVNKEVYFTISSEDRIVIRREKS